MIGDFIQLPVTTGCDLLIIMYGTVSGNDGSACNLFQQFHVKELPVNIRSSECQIHMRRVAGFRTSPQMYPSGQKWTAEDNKLYKPITKDVLDGVTHQLTLPDVDQCPMEAYRKTSSIFQLTEWQLHSTKNQRIHQCQFEETQSCFGGTNHQHCSSLISSFLRNHLGDHLGINNKSILTM